MKRALIGLAWAMTCAAQTLPPELRVGDETVPPGEKVQLKLSLTDPRPISTGKTSLTALDEGFFDEVVGVALFSSSGDVAGAALVQGRQVSARFTSSKGTFGTEPDYPIMTVVVGTKPVPIGTKTVVTINPNPIDSFWAYLGLNYPATVKPGTITAGGTLSVSNVVPGGGPLPAGFVVKLLGTGFASDTTVQVENTLPLSSVRLVNSGEIHLTLAQAANMQGQRIRVKNKDGSQVTYFSYLRATSLGNSSRGAVLPFTVPIFSNATAGGYLPSSSVPSGSYTGLALQNSNQSPATVSVDLLSAGGQVLAPQVKVFLLSGMRYVKEVAELFALPTVPAGSGVRVSSDVPVHMLGLITDEAARSVTPVGLSAAAPPAAQLTASPLLLRFDYKIGDPPPAAQSIALASSAGTIPFSVTLAPPAPWLTVSPVSGATPPTSSLSVTAQPNGLPAGTYTTSINISPSSGTAASIPVTLTVTDRTTPVIGGIVNAANQQTGALSLGEIVTAYGIFPGVPVTGLALDSAGKVATTLGGMRVLFDGFPAPLTYVSATQINAVVPYEISDSSITRVRAELAGVLSPELTVATTPAAPAIFTVNSSGSGPGAVLNQDFSPNTASNPAARGSVISIFGTGEGRTTPAGVTGGVTGADLKNPVLQVTATIGGQPARVFYAGSAPGLVAGVLQVNIEVPDNVTPGSAVEVIIMVSNKGGGATSQAGVTIAVQ